MRSLENKIKERASKLDQEYGDEFWDRKREDLARRMEEDDLDQFLTWPTVVSTMFVGELPTLSKDQEVVDDWFGYTQPKDSLVGSPPQIPIENTANTIRQLRHMAELERSLLEKSIADVGSIVEFGAGYGLFCYLCHELEFRGRYDIIDFPEFCLLQEYYLEKSGIVNENIHWVTNIDHLDGREYELLIAMDSLTEVEDQGYRERFLQRAPSKFYFIRYTPGQGNVTWAEEVISATQDHVWEEKQDIADKDKKYLMGKRMDNQEETSP